MRIHLLVNIHRPDAIQAAKDAADWLVERGVEVAADIEGAPRIQVEPVEDENFGQADLVVSFGGDGTLIHAAHLCSEFNTPILGVYYGRFGFVTQCQGGELGACLSAFFDGKSIIEERMMLQTKLLRGGQTIACLHSLNEMVLQRAVTTRMLNFEVSVDGHRLTTYPADGMIVSTATGSTAYNLSVGGPIMDPRVQAIVLSAIAPHTLSARALLLGPDSVVRLRLVTEGEAVLSADGQTKLHLLSQDEVEVSRSSRVTRLICVDKDDFLIKLGERLFWSHSVLGE